MMEKYCFECGKILADCRSIRCKSCANKDKNHPNWKGKKYIVLYCQDCGKRIRSHRWMGGITPQRLKEYKTEQYKKFVNSVLKRDNYTCKECGIKNGYGKNI